MQIQGGVITTLPTVVTSQTTASVSSGSALDGPGLQVNVVNSTKTPIGVNLTGGQSSVTVTGNVSINALSTSSKIQVELSTTLMGGSTASPMNVVWTGWANSAASTWASIIANSTALFTLFSSGASTRYNLTDIAMTNQGAAETVVTVYDGTTSGTILFRAACASAGGGIVKNFSMPRPNSSGLGVIVECVPASTVYIDAAAFRSA